MIAVESDWLDYPRLGGETGGTTAAPILGSLIEDERMAPGLITSRPVGRSGAPTQTRPTVVCGSAFVILTSDGWLALPADVRRAATATFDASWTWGGTQLLRLRTCQQGAAPTRLDLTDVVVRCYPNAGVAAWQLKQLVVSQLAQLISGHALTGLGSARAAMASSSISIAEGRSSTVKTTLRVKGVERIVCVTESVVALRDAFGAWAVGLMIAGKPVDSKVITYASLAQGPAPVRAQFGRALGRIMAHEARHQLCLTGDPVYGGLRHAADGLGRDGAPFWQEGLAFDSTDRAAITTAMQTLAAAQRGRPTEAVDRG